MNIEARIQNLDGRTMMLAEGIAVADGTVEDGMIEIDFRLSTTGEEVTVEETISAGSVFRIPRAGDVALLAFVDGDRNEGYVIGWIPRPDAQPCPSISAGTLYVHARPGEEIRIVSDGDVTVDASSINLGDSAASFIALSDKVDALWSAFYGMFSGWLPLSDVDSKSLKIAFLGAFPAPPVSVRSSKVRSE